MSPSRLNAELVENTAPADKLQKHVVFAFVRPIYWYFMSITTALEFKFTIF